MGRGDRNRRELIVFGSPEDLEHGRTLESDICVMGAGAAGIPFAVLPNGESVINVHGAGFRPGARILFDGVPLQSSVGNSGWMNAYVPAEHYAHERIAEITVRNPDGKTSSAIRFEVAPGAPPPTLSRIVPPRTHAGTPFAVQPNGVSVINVHGAGFRPGARILFDGAPLESSVGNSGWMNAYVPAEYYAHERIAEITVRNPDGKTSSAIRFEVVPASD